MLLAGCASRWEQRVAPAQERFYQGDPAVAAALLADRLDADPTGPDAHVLRLELGSALAADGRPAESAQTLVGLDDDLEILDYSSAPIADLGAFLFALDPPHYRARRHERLLLNTLNLLNFLALGDWEGAAVEARRARVLMLQEDLPEDERFQSPLAWGLAGVALQLAGRDAEADDAFRSSARLPGAAPLTGTSAPPGPAVPLAPPSPLGSPGPPAPADPPAPPSLWNLSRRPGPGQGSVLVVVQNGKAPVRVEATYYLFLDGAPHRLQIPALVSRPGKWNRAVVHVDDVPVGEAPVLLDIAGQVRARYDREFPRLLAAAAIAAVPRALAGAAVRRQITSRDVDGQANKDLQQFFGFVAGFFVEETLAEALPADTRGWTLLPADVRALRVNVPAGTHTVAVALHGQGTQRLAWEVTVEDGGFALVNAITATGEGWQPAPPPRSRDMTGAPEGQQALELLEAALLLREVWD